MPLDLAFCDQIKQFGRFSRVVDRDLLLSFGGERCERVARTLKVGRIECARLILSPDLYKALSANTPDQVITL